MTTPIGSKQHDIIRDLLAQDDSPTAISEAAGVLRQAAYPVQDDPAKAETMLAEWEWNKGRRGHSFCLFVGEARSFAARGEFRTDLRAVVARRFVRQLLKGGLAAIRPILDG